VKFQQNVASHVLLLMNCDVVQFLVDEHVYRDYINRPGVAQRVPGGLGPQIFMTFGTCRW